MKQVINRKWIVSCNNPTAMPNYNIKIRELWQIVPGGWNYEFLHQR